MKKKFKAKVSGMFDIVQLGDDTFSEDGRLEILKSERIGRTRDIKQEYRDRIIEELNNFRLNGNVQQLERPGAPY